MPPAVTSGVAPAAGAGLYFERRGDGPPLLMITGGSGDAGYYSFAAARLAGYYTVITYDRRGNSRSPLHDGPVPITMASQSEDAVAVLSANGFGAATIFGNSGGATIVLDLAARHPEVIEAAVAHEPPVPALLPDAREYLAIYADIDRVLAAEGWEPAFRMFQERIGLVPPDHPQIFTALLNPAQVFPPGPVLDQMTRLSRNWAYMMTYEVPAFIGYRPDVAGIRASRAAHGFPLVIGYGASTRDQAAVQMSRCTAEVLGVGCVKFSGGHTAPNEIPTIFARELRALLTRLTAPGPQ
jgi:acetyltransferase/esterase